jgi:PLD-like domain
MSIPDIPLDPPAHSPAHVPAPSPAHPPPHSPPRPGVASRLAHAAKMLLLLVLLVWLSVVLWNTAKPLPPGTHVVSQTARLSDADVEFLYESPRHQDSFKREELPRHDEPPQTQESPQYQDSPRRQGPPAEDLAAVDHAEQLIVVDRSPVTPELAGHLLARKRQRPNLKIVVVTDPGNEAFGGSAPSTLASLEEAGAIVARVRLDRLRDSNPLYSGVWRLAFGWWSDPFDESPGDLTMAAWSRMRNFKADQRQLVVADDSAGGWIASMEPTGAAGLVLHGSLARAMIAGELQIAAWSTEDDRLPSSPRMEGRGVGSIDARFLTEGAIEGALLEAISAAASGDQICMAVQNLSDRRLIAAMSRAAARGAHLQVLLARNPMPNQAVAGELLGEAAGRIEVRWYAAAYAVSHSGLLLVRHGADVWMNLGSADFTRRNLGDLNLEAAVELRMPVRSAPARAASEYFAEQWSGASADAPFAQTPIVDYWRYRFAEATGLSSF